MAYVHSDLYDYLQNTSLKMASSPNDLSPEEVECD